MTGSQFPKTYRATSSSPKLKIGNGTAISKDIDMQFQKKNLLTPIKPGKRNRQSIISPSNCRTESLSPKAKFRFLSSPVTFKDTSSLSPATFSENLSQPKETNSLNNTLAVPKVSAEPPNPSVLPIPPQRWIGERNAQCLAKKQQCKEITQCLVTHLASSGILIAAQ